MDDMVRVEDYGNSDSESEDQSQMKNEGEEFEEAIGEYKGIYYDDEPG